jgi:DNA primase
MNAALKSLPIFLNEGLLAKAVRLPEGHDPDSYVNQNGVESLNILLQNAKPMFDFYIDCKLSGNDLDIEGKVRAVKDIIPVIQGLDGDTQRALYVKRLAERIGVKEDIILSELSKWDKSRNIHSRRESEEGPVLSGNSSKGFIGDMQLLNLMLFYPETVPRLMECDCRILLSDPKVKQIVDTIFSKYENESLFLPEDLTDDLKSEEECVLVRDILHEPFIVYSDEEVEQAVSDFERQVDRVKLSESIKKVKGDAEALNQILEIKRSKEHREYN